MPILRRGMHKAFDSVIGLPKRSTSALRILAFLIPPEVRSNFMMSFKSWIVVGSHADLPGDDSTTNDGTPNRPTALNRAAAAERTPAIEASAAGEHRGRYAELSIATQT